MLRGDELTKVKVLIKAFLICNPGRHTAGEIANFINSGNFGLVHGVSAAEIGALIKKYKNQGNNFLNEIQSETRFPKGGVREYFLLR